VASQSLKSNTQVKIILQINAGVEILAGFILLFSPHLLLNHVEPNIQGIVVSKMYGILAFSFGILSLVLSRHFEYSVLFKQIVLIIIAFHFAVGMHMYGVYKQNVTTHVGAAALHIGLAIIFILIYLKNIQKFNT
jgi:hypothetical protein